ncbi:MAG: PilW family protein [Magnetococcales bacterium]|nr:PilW family protein [Magnetococcales bacterium]
MNTASQKNNPGFTLVEMMIGITLGLLLMLGVIKIIDSNTQSNVLMETLSEVQGTGRFVLNYLGNNLRLTGYPRESTNIITAITGTNGTGTNLSDAITVQYESSTNCAGAATGGTITQDTFFIQLNAAGLPELNCTATVPTGFTTYAIVDGVESLQILYGEDMDNPTDGQVNRYSNAANVSNWSNVIALRIGVVVASINAITVSQNPITLLLDENALPAVADGRLRRTFYTTIMLRNMKEY